MDLQELIVFFIAWRMDFFVNISILRSMNASDLTMALFIVLSKQLLKPGMG